MKLLRLARLRLPLLALIVTTLTLPAAEQGRWIAAWVASQQPTEPAAMKPAVALQGRTLRQIVQPSLAGDSLRIALSNQYGEKPLHISGAHIARSLGESAIDPATDHKVLFAGQASVTILPGSTVLSDVVSLPVQPFVNLAVSLQLDSVPSRLTGHPGSRTTSFLQEGDQLAKASLPGAEHTDQWFVLSSVEVETREQSSAIVVVGDSITDGRGSTTNANDRWPNLLARRLHGTVQGAQVSVLNQGVGAGRVLRDGVGDSILRRFDRDVLAVPGVRWLVIFGGVNDIGGACKPGPSPDAGRVAKELIQAYRQLALRAHSHGIRVIGATIMPFEGFDAYYNADSEASRQEVNRWIRESGVFDGVIDFDLITRDPQNPRRLSAAVDSGDHIHPCAVGHRIMGEAVDLSLFLSPTP